MTPARAYLYSLGELGIKLGLEQIRSLVAALDRPDEAYRSIVVAGTNGKGSVTAMIERGLRAAGYRTGRFTSPHLVRLEERFAIDGTDVGDRQFDAALARVRGAAAHLHAPPSFFEATTAAALELFRSCAVDVAVLEVGLGGRLDATNVVVPVASAITAVDFDHQQYLGNTLAAIAAEKAGVIKAGSFAVLAANPPLVEAVVAGRCDEVGADLVRCATGVTTSVDVDAGRITLDLDTPRRHYASLALALRGRHQVQNVTTAARMLEELSARGLFEIPAEAIRLAVEDVAWPARLELMRADGFDVLIDGAHNAAGARALADYLHETYGRRLPLVLGIMRDKDVAAVATTLAATASVVVCTAPQTPRAMPPEDLAAIITGDAPAAHVAVARDARAALALASRLAHGESPVVVAGSLYLAGEVRAEIP